MKIDYFVPMKSQFLLFLFFTTSFITFGQKKYSFDYAIEYNFQKNETSKVEKEIFLTNSKDNSYVLRVIDKDSLNYRIFFVDQNGTLSDTYISKKDFFKAETFELKCEFASRYSNPYKYQTDNYDFIIQKDTLIDNSDYQMYIIKSNKSKRAKRKKLGTTHFIIEKNTYFHLPIFEEPTSYEEWKKEKNIPNGIPKQFYFTKYSDNKRLCMHNLVHFVKINKFLVIPKECDFTDSLLSPPTLTVK